MDNRIIAPSSYHCHVNERKFVEIYMFFDPLCPECWALEPIIKKLQIEYGRYFSIKYVLSGRLAMLNLAKREHYDGIAELWERTATRTGMSCDGTLWVENPLSAPHLAYVAIKAAELQGRKASVRFLRKLRERLFLIKENVTELSILKEIAEQAGLDVDEFLADIHSESAAKAFQCDLKLTSEMEVQELPTLVFFNENIEEEGIKITGDYPYEVYEQILTEMIPVNLEKNSPPSLESFLKCFQLLGSKEIAIVYNKTINEVELEMKKLQLMQIVEQIPAKYGVFWRYLDK